VKRLRVCCPHSPRDLLNGIESRIGGKVWASALLPELSRSAAGISIILRPIPGHRRLRQRCAPSSQTNDGSAPANTWLYEYHTFGCGHPHIFTDAPYEEYERQFSPPKLLNAPPSSSSFCFPGRQHWIAALRSGQCGRTLAQKAFGAAQMSNFGDWRSLLDAYASVTPTI